MNHTLSQRQTLRRHRENLDQVTRDAEGSIEPRRAVYEASSRLMWIFGIALVVVLVLSAQGVV
jgi:hypothetical protein